MFVRQGIARDFLFLLAVEAIAPPSLASASPEGFCAELGGMWDGAQTTCEMSFARPGTALDQSQGQHTVKIAAQYPADLIDNPTAGPVLRKHVRDFSANFGNSKDWLLNDAGSNITYQLYEHSATVRTVVFHNVWFVQGAAHLNDELHAFTFDLAAGRQLALADILQPGLDPLVVLPPLVRPYLQASLGRSNGTNSSKMETWEFEPKTADHPDSYSDGYQAFALAKDELILMMPALRRGPMDTGLIAPHVPLTALRPEFLPS